MVEVSEQNISEKKRRLEEAYKADYGRKGKNY